MERFVPTWMKSAPSIAATNAIRSMSPFVCASAVPTSTGATAAGSVRGRAAISQIASEEGLRQLRHARLGNREKSGRRRSL